MINVAIVDDEISSVERIKEYLDKYEKENGASFKIETFSDGDKIVCKYDNQFDIIFMDVEMKFMDGISAAEEIRRVDSEVVIIFITNMMQYAIQGYAVQAFNYLLKPVSYFAFSHCLNKALSLRDNRKNKFALLNIKGGTARIDIKDIYFIETQGHVTICHVVNGEYQLTQTMREVESKLCDSHFFRISKGYLINLAYVENFDNNEVKIGKFTLPVSRTRKKDFFKALMTYWGGGS